VGEIPWFYVDDQLCTHSKAIEAGNAALGLWVRAGSWCRRELKDGEVSADVVRMLGTKAQADRLASSGLWMPDGSGYRFHDWGQWQKTAEQVKAEREATRTRVQQWRANKRNGVTPPVTNAVSNGVRTGKSLSPSLVVTSVGQSSPQELDDDGLIKIRHATKGDFAHARRTADLILSRAATPVLNPVRYVLAAIEAQPELYRWRRGNPTKATACPDHPGEWADACRIHATEGGLT